MEERTAPYESCNRRRALCRMGQSPCRSFVQFVGNSRARWTEPRVARFRRRSCPD